MTFDKKSRAELLKIASQHKDVLKGFSTMKKEDLVKTMKKHLKMTKGGAIERKGGKGGKIVLPKEKPILKKVKPPSIPVEAPQPPPPPRSTPIPPRRPIIHYEGRPLTEHERRQRARFGMGLSKDEMVNQLKERIMGHIRKIQGGQLPDSFTDKLHDLQLGKVEGAGVVAEPKKEEPKKEDGDWEEGGSFTDLFNQYNRTHDTKMKSLKDLAEHILKSPGDYKEKTKKRARFYINVILKKKSTS